MCTWWKRSRRRTLWRRWGATSSPGISTSTPGMSRWYSCCYMCPCPISLCSKKATASSFVNVWCNISVEDGTYAFIYGSSLGIPTSKWFSIILQEALVYLYVFLKVSSLKTQFAFLCLIYIAFVHYHWMLLIRAMFLMDLCGEYIRSPSRAVFTDDPINQFCSFYNIVQKTFDTPPPFFSDIL